MSDSKYQLFTPYVKESTNLRAHMQLDAVDMDKFDNLPGGNTGKTVVVFDHMSNTKYEIKRDSCGSGCYCAAVIVREVPE